jgi:ankyrin repeat protein
VTYFLQIKLNQQTNDGFTALMLSSQNGHQEIVQMLLKIEQININQQNEDGLTALMAASGRGNLDIVKLLIAKGLDVNKVGDSGGTAVVYAASDGHVEVVKVLISANADVNIIVKGAVKYIEKVRVSPQSVNDRMRVTNLNNNTGTELIGRIRVPTVQVC